MRYRSARTWELARHLAPILAGDRVRHCFATIGPHDALDYNRKSVSLSQRAELPGSSHTPSPRYFADASLVSIILAIIIAVVGLAVGYAMARARQDGAARVASMPIPPPPVEAAQAPLEDAAPAAPAVP